VNATAEPQAAASTGEQLRALWRRRRTMLVVFALSALVTLPPAFLLAARYQASGTILIEQQEIPQDFVRSTITSFATQRIQIISQRVMTTQNLLAIIERYDLYADVKKTLTREALLERMRGDVTMKMISADVIDPRSGSPTKATIAFSVAYESPSPELAYKVASELVTLYLNENATSRAKQTEIAATFLAEEGARLRAQMSDLEAKLTEFKKAHAGRLPELTQLNVQTVDRTELELRDIRNHLDTLEQQRLLIVAQLAQINPTASIFSDSGQRVLTPEDRLKGLKATLAALEARYSPDHPDVAMTRRQIAGLEQKVSATPDRNDLVRQLEDAKAKLAVARQTYSGEHPDVKQLERLVAGLEESIAAAPPAPASYAGKADNPVYLQVKGQLDALLAERDALHRREDQARARLNDFEHRVAAAPDIEEQYRALVRDYDGAYAKYREIRAKQMEAQVSQNLETERKGERFTLIEPPLPPQAPISPNRKLILVMGMLVSVLLGVGVAVVRETLDGTVRGSTDLRRLLEVAPLAEVPVIVTSAERARQRLAQRLAWGGTALTAGLLVAAVHLYVRPLDLLWLAVQRKFGS
jgi:succinoglycan biosynthesis transport protein ExoP